MVDDPSGKDKDGDNDRTTISQVAPSALRPPAKPSQPAAPPTLRTPPLTPPPSAPPPNPPQPDPAPPRSREVQASPPSPPRPDPAPPRAPEPRAATPAPPSAGPAGGDDSDVTRIIPRQPPPKPPADDGDDGDRTQVIMPPGPRGEPLYLQRTAPAEFAGQERLDRSRYLVGRSDTADLRLHSMSASREHARIVRRGAKWVLSALEGKTVLVDDEVVEDEVELEATMRLAFGEDEFVVLDPSQVKDAPRVEQAPAAGRAPVAAARVPVAAAPPPATTSWVTAPVAAGVLGLVVAAMILWFAPGGRQAPGTAPSAQTGSAPATSLPSPSAVAPAPAPLPAAAAPTPAPAAEPVLRAYVNARTLNIRAEPGTDAPMVGVLLKHDQVVITDQRDVGQNVWYAIDAAGGYVDGWVSGAYLDFVPRPEPVTGEMDYGARATPTLVSGNFKYIGAEGCKHCHVKATGQFPLGAYPVWQHHVHADAYQVLGLDYTIALSKRLRAIAEPQKAWQCLKCHTTAYGAAPEQLAATYKDSEGVTCEACHGPGSEYAKVKHDASNPEREKLGFLKLTDIDERAQLCQKCHNALSPTYKAFNVMAFSRDVLHWADAKDATYVEWAENHPPIHVAPPQAAPRAKPEAAGPAPAQEAKPAPAAPAPVAEAKPAPAAPAKPAPAAPAPVAEAKPAPAAPAPVAETKPAPAAPAPVVETKPAPAAPAPVAEAKPAAAPEPPAVAKAPQPAAPPPPVAAAKAAPASAAAPEAPAAPAPPAVAKAIAQKKQAEQESAKKVESTAASEVKAAAAGGGDLRKFLTSMPATLTLNKNGERKNPVKFTHTAHASEKYVPGVTCKTCHHTQKGNEKPEDCMSCHNVGGDAEETSAKTRATHKDSAVPGGKHVSCVGCHKSMNELNAKSAPTECRDCHTSKGT